MHAGNQTVEVGVAPQAVMKLLRVLGAEEFPALKNAILKSGNHLLRKWVDTVKNAKSKEGWKRKYMEAIQLSRTGPLTISVMAEKNLYVSLVEEGRRRMDMKDPGEGWLSGEKVKTNKKGQPYLVIPFRHGVPGSRRNPMPKSVHDKIKSMTGDEISRRYRVAGATASGRKRYTGMPARFGATGMPKLKKHHTASIYAGMVRTGGARHGQYYTFRVLSVRGRGWIIPAVPAAHAFDKVGKSVGPEIKKILADGLKKDLSRMGGSV